MNILIIGKFGPEEFGAHIKEELEIMGNNVLTFHFGPNFNQQKQKRNSKYIKAKSLYFNIISNSTSKLRQLITKELIKKVHNKKIDLIICTKDFLIDSEVEMLNKITKAKIVMWFPDHIGSFGRSHFLTAPYDALFFKDTFIVENLKSIYGKNAYYLPECFNPRHHKLIEFNENDSKKYSSDISLIGNLHAARVELLKQLLNYDIKVYGQPNPWWLNIKGIERFFTNQYVGYEEKSKVIKYSKISLNTVYISEVNGVNARTFELAGAGGFQIVQWKKDLESLFEIDKEIVTFRNLNELKQKLDFYLSHEEERNKIAQAAHKRANRDHTYNQRLNQMLEIIFQNKGV